MPPWADLMERIAAALESSSRPPSVLAGLVPQVTPDAIVIRPDGPWIGRSGDGRPVRFTSNMERYVAICAVRVSDPGSAMADLYGYARAVMEAASDDGWDWVDVGPMRPGRINREPVTGNERPSNV